MLFWRGCGSVGRPPDFPHALLHGGVPGFWGLSGTVSFSNAFYNSSTNLQSYGDQASYVIFGGLNSSQIVGGEKGLQTLSLIKGKLNPTMYWGTTGRGFKYGSKTLMDAQEDTPVLAVIDSGTTLMILP